MNWSERLLGRKAQSPALPAEMTEELNRVLDERLASLQQQVASMSSVSMAVRDSLAALNDNDLQLSHQLAALEQEKWEWINAGQTGAALDAPLERSLALIAEWVQRNDDQLASLNDQLQKLNRGTFKANTLAESQAKRTDSALDSLSSAVEQHQADILQLQQQVQSQVRQARLAVVQAMLPVLDGIEQALASGQDYLQRRSVQAGRPPSLGERIAIILGRQPLPMGLDAATVQAWLAGLALVRERMVDLLAVEGVRAIPTVGQPFDPYKHNAVALADPARYAAAPGSIVEELRRGYAAGERVLRFAEVSVMPMSRPPATPPGGSGLASVSAQADFTGATPPHPMPAADSLVAATTPAETRPAPGGGAEDVAGAGVIEATQLTPGGEQDWPPSEAHDTLDPYVRELLHRFEERQQSKQQK